MPGPSALTVPKDWDRVATAYPAWWSLDLSTPTAAGTIRRYFRVVDEAGFTLRRFWLLTGTAIGRHAVNFYTFKPFLVTVKDGVPSVQFLGTGRSTSSYGVAADVPFRIHDEDRFNLKIPKGAAVGLDIVTTGTPTAVPVKIQASVIHVR